MTAKRLQSPDSLTNSIWSAALKVADENFEIPEQDKVRGIITAERTMTAWAAGAWVGIYIVPANDGAESYRIKVVSRKKLVTNIGEQGWEGKVRRDI